MTNNEPIKLNHTFRAYEVTRDDGTTFLVHSQWRAIGHVQKDRFGNKPGWSYKSIEVPAEEWHKIPS